MTGIASFEVLAQPIVPGVPNVPYVQQGSFLQVTNITGQTLVVSLTYYPSPGFVPSRGAVSLFANYIDNRGEVTQIPANTFISQRGFVNVAIPLTSTFIFGVQYIVTPTQSSHKAGFDAAGWRGHARHRLLPEQPRHGDLPTADDPAGFQQLRPLGQAPGYFRIRLCVPFEKYPALLQIVS